MLQYWRQRWAILFIVIGSLQLRHVVSTFIRLAPNGRGTQVRGRYGCELLRSGNLVHDHQEDDRGQDGKDNQSEMVNSPYTPTAGNTFPWSVMSV
jgi:hypothetical protein